MFKLIPGGGKKRRARSDGAHACPGVTVTLESSCANPNARYLSELPIVTACAAGNRLAGSWLQAANGD
jgi:hypothetical protein